ncbi:uncharacterized protein LOC129225306 [Uloborus diversus]|uniref:uncharacterized protein LOC129225306 n=1 Tax=Uloborus diversus TaxID=327109 RepID=UPI0024098649|nr:uncharacterized protein LOC129225306 [Uloborus diversus]
MSRNVEIKAKIKDFRSFLLRASEISDKPAFIMKQTDTYFKVLEGRLKLRQIQDQVAELIFYNRPDTEGPKLSSYRKQTFKNADEAEGLKKVLESSLGLVGIVKKERHLFMYERTRIHVDDVEHLGHFMELEVMLNEDETLEQGQEIADSLMSKLGVSKSDLISGSYINML